LASLPAHIIHALQTFDPVSLIERFITHQLTYAQIIATSLTSAAHDFASGLVELPAAFQSAVQALAMGNVSGAVRDIADGFLRLFVTGVHEDITGDPLSSSGLVITVTPEGTLGDLLPILSIPGMMAQNFTDLLPPGSIPAHISQNFTNVIDTVTNTGIEVNAFLTLGGEATATAKLGLPVALIIDALGAPYNAVHAFGSSATAFVHDLQTGNLPGALATLFDAPAVVTNAFLNGETTLDLSFPVPNVTETFPGGALLGGTLTLTNNTAAFSIPLDGILVPQTTMTGSFDGTASGTGVTGIALAALFNALLPIDDVVVGGTPTSGLATGLLVSAPEALALAITPP
jgi:hypothetical protein